MNYRYFVIGLLMLVLNLSCKSDKVEEGSTRITYTDATFVKSNANTQAGDLEISDLRISKVSKTGQEQAAEVQLGNSSADLVNSFNAPDSISTEFWEMSEKEAFVYHYSGNKFYFLDDKLETFDLTSPDFLVGNATAGYVRVGQPASDVTDRFLPNSVATPEHYIKADIITKGIYTDSFLIVNLNSENNLITGFRINTY